MVKGKQGKSMVTNKSPGNANNSLVNTRKRQSVASASLVAWVNKTTCSGKS